MVLRQPACMKDEIKGKDGAPDRIRTCGPQIRNLVLYPAELRAHCFESSPQLAANRTVINPGA